MKLMSKLRLVLAIIVLSIFSCSEDDDSQKNVDNDFRTILGTALQNPDLSMFAELLGGSSSITQEFYRVRGPLTVFVPNNDALQKFLDIKEVTLIDDLSLGDKEEVLLRSTILERGLNIDQLQGGFHKSRFIKQNSSENVDLYVNIVDGVPTINGDVSVISPDIISSNGVIHVVDDIVSSPDFFTFIESDPRFSMFNEAININPDFSIREEFLIFDLDETGAVLETRNRPSTLFVPSNEAFQALLDSNAEWNSLSDINEDLLEKILSLHFIRAEELITSTFVDGELTNRTFNSDERLTTSISTDGAGVSDSSGTVANIITRDINAQSGVIHLIDRVLVPAVTPLRLRGNIIEKESGSILVPTTEIIGEIQTGAEANFELHITNIEAGFDQVISISSVAISADNASTLELIPASPIFNTDQVSLTYSGEGIRSIFLGTMEPFENVQVSPYFDNAFDADEAGFELPNSNFRKAFLDNFWANGTQNGSDANPIYARTTEQRFTGEASIVYRGNPATDNPSLQAAALSLFGNSITEPGDYVATIRVFVSPESNLQEIRTAIRFPSPVTQVFWDISAVEKGVWVTLPIKEFNFAEAAVPDQNWYALRIRAFDNPGINQNQEIYIDDMIFAIKEPRL